MARNRTPQQLVIEAFNIEGTNPKVASLLLGNQRDVITRVVNGTSSVTEERAKDMVIALKNSTRSFGDLMCEIRQQFNLKAKDVAPALGVDPRVYGKKESGTLDVTFSEFKDFLNYTVSLVD